MEFDQFPIEDQLKNGLQTSRLDACEIWLLLIENQLKNGRKSAKLASYEIWSFLNQEWIKE